jgi:hypothetical protein
MSPRSIAHIVSAPVRYVFYQILSWKLRDSREDTPVLVASLATSILLWFNAVAAVMVWNGLLGRNSLLPLPYTRLELYGGAAVLLVVAHLAMARIWVDNGNYAKLVEEFETANRRRRRVRLALFWSYIAVSALLPPCLVIFWPKSPT